MTYSYSIMKFIACKFIHFSLHLKIIHAKNTVRQMEISKKAHLASLIRQMEVSKDTSILSLFSKTLILQLLSVLYKYIFQKSDLKQHDLANHNKHYPHHLDWERYHLLQSLHLSYEVKRVILL